MYLHREKGLYTNTAEVSWNSKHMGEFGRQYKYFAVGVLAKHVTSFRVGAFTKQSGCFALSFLEPNVFNRRVLLTIVTGVAAVVHMRIKLDE
jgi:hypothetical protein